MKKQVMTTTYVLFGAFVLIIITAITCGDNTSQGEKSTPMPETLKEVKEVVEEKVEEVKVEVEEKVEEIKSVVKEKVKDVVKEKKEQVIEEKAKEVIEDLIPEPPVVPEIKELPIELPEVAPTGIQEEVTE